MNGPAMYSTALCREEYISDLLRCVSFLYTGSFQLPKWQPGFFWLKAPSSVSVLACSGSVREWPCVNNNQIPADEICGFPVPGFIESARK